MRSRDEPRCGLLSERLCRDWLGRIQRLAKDQHWK